MTLRSGSPWHSGSWRKGSATTWFVAVTRPCCSCQSAARSARWSHFMMWTPCLLYTSPSPRD
eukprot:6588203-Alexandrium_andersonii.AAC.1